MDYYCGFSLCLAFLLQLLLSVSLSPASGPQLALVIASLLLSLASALSVAALARLVTSLGVMVVTQGGLTLASQLLPALTSLSGENNGGSETKKKDRAKSACQR